MSKKNLYLVLKFNKLSIFRLHLWIICVKFYWILPLVLLIVKITTSLLSPLGTGVVLHLAFYNSAEFDMVNVSIVTETDRQMTGRGTDGRRTSLEVSVNINSLNQILKLFRSLRQGGARGGTLKCVDWFKFTRTLALNMSANVTQSNTEQRLRKFMEIN